MSYLSRCDEADCRDFVVSFYRPTMDGPVVICETRVRCASDDAAIRVARYELGDLVASLHASTLLNARA